MFLTDDVVLVVGEVGDRARHPTHAVVAASGEPVALELVAQPCLGGRRKACHIIEQRRRHCCVQHAAAQQRPRPGPLDPPANDGRGLTAADVDEVVDPRALRTGGGLS